MRGGSQSPLFFGILQGMNGTGETTIPSISVIVPVRNAASFLDACVRSLEAQTLAPAEIILVDDASTDETPQVLQKLQEEFSNLVVAQGGGKGVSHSRNVGLSLARGEYVSFVDADDRVLPDMLRVLWETLRSEQADLSSCRPFFFRSENEWTMLSRAGGSTEDINVYTSVEFLRQRVLQENGFAWARLYPLSVLGDCYFDEDLSIGEDILFVTSLLPRLTRVAECSRALYGYYQNPKSAMQRSFVPQYMDQIRGWEKIREKAALLDPSTRALSTSHLIKAILLTVGKLAELSPAERKTNAEYVAACHEKLCEEVRNRDAFSLLSAGYRLKSRLFCALPQLYLQLYHFHKYKPG